MHAILRPLAAAAILCLAGASAHAGKQDFTLYNNTGYGIDKLFVSSVGAKTWEEDILGRDTLDDGESFAISFENGERGCHYDMKVVYHDGDQAEWGNVNLCELTNIHIHWDKKAGVTRASGD
jgi:hypothetical protein